ncbi:MAG: IS3 family transposase [Candidatus Neomarinimicrobiota bacterium]
MGSKRIRRTKELKFKIALEAIRGEKQVSEIAKEYHVHPQQIGQWKRELLDRGADLYATQKERDSKRLEAERDELFKTIGQQQVVIDWFKKKLDLTPAKRAAMIDRDGELPVAEQCRILLTPRSNQYYHKKGETEKNLTLMRRIDELYTDHPTWGSRKLRDRLRLEAQRVNRKRIQRLLRVMGLEVLYPKRNLSRPTPEATIYPYLLRNLLINRPNQVWCTDITYIRLVHGFVYLVAVLDWFSKHVLTWRLSVTLDKSFCLDALEEALRWYGKPEIFNTDQGSQFTSPKFLKPLEDNGIKISMDGRGRACDNIIVERFWRTLKYDEVYLKDYHDVKEAKVSIGKWIKTYNTFRPHQALGGLTPECVYQTGWVENAA